MSVDPLPNLGESESYVVVELGKGSRLKDLIELMGQTGVTPFIDFLN